jgi:alpha-glucosidase (family GH31 glycosyl hydrolase)
MWETQFNNFEPDPSRFPDFSGLVTWLHDQDIRVILWATSMVNIENPDYDMCVTNNYLVRNGQGVVRPLGWWHGQGALLDYSNPDAVSWWHSKMDPVLEMGIDGWKTDGTDPYIAEYIILSGAALGYENISLSYRDYANYYYRDFFSYTREKRGEVGLIMSRPVDCQIDRLGSFCTPYSPRDVMLSGWVGDDDNTFNGLKGCMKKVIYSAWDGYANFGCDIGGYRQEEEPSKQVNHLSLCLSLSLHLSLSLFLPPSLYLSVSLSSRLSLSLSFCLSLHVSLSR